MSDEQPKHPGGRPTLYRTHYPEQAYKLTLLGATDKELANFFEVCTDTINEWKIQHPQFSVSVIDGKIKADAEVAHKLFNKAIGPTWTEEQAFKVKKKFTDENGNKCELEEVIVIPVKRSAPPDTPAISLWLRNRQGLRWRDTQNVEVDHTGEVGVVSSDMSELCRYIASIAAQDSARVIQGHVLSGSLLPAEIRTE